MQTRGIDETTQTKTKSANNAVFVCLFVLRRAAQRELRLGLSTRPLPLGCGPSACHPYSAEKLDLGPAENAPRHPFPSIDCLVPSLPERKLM